MSAPKSYRLVLRLFLFFYNAESIGIREMSDDGILMGLVLGPLIPSSLLFSSLKQISNGGTILPTGWLIDTPAVLENSHKFSHKIISFAGNFYFALQLGRP